MSRWVKASGIASVHLWSLDRDKGCAPRHASSTCNSDGAAGPWCLSNAFATTLGL